MSEIHDEIGSMVVTEADTDEDLARLAEAHTRVELLQLQTEKRGLEISLTEKFGKVVFWKARAAIFKKYKQKDKEKANEEWAVLYESLADERTAMVSVIKEIESRCAQLKEQLRQTAMVGDPVRRRQADIQEEILQQLIVSNELLQLLVDKALGRI